MGHDRKWLRPSAPCPDEDYSLKSSGNIVMKMVTSTIARALMVRVNACARRSTRRGGSSRRLLGRSGRRNGGRSRSRRGRGSSRSHAWFTATVHHAHFSSAALADRGTHCGVPYTDAIDQLTPQATSLANLNDRIVRLLKWDVRHTLCGGHKAQRERNDGGSDHCFLPVVTERRRLSLAGCRPLDLRQSS